MRPAYRLSFLLALLVLPAVVVETASAACDTVANASALASARDAIDAACSCAAAAKLSDHIKCAKPVVAARITGGMLTKACKGEALKHATKSICGRPGAVVCCRVKPNGKTSHKVAKDPAKCVDTVSLDACISPHDSVPSGCDASGCLTAVCGNGFLEAGETCEPPDTSECDAYCHTITCDPPVTTCGNSDIDAGETCEPPGVGACDWSCQTTTCAASGPGEIDVACAAGGATVAAGARASEYLLAWNDLTYRPQADLVARRFDADGAAVDTLARVVSQGAPCGGAHKLPSIGSNADQYVLAWYTQGTLGSGPSYAATNARPYDANGNLGHLDELIRRIPFGMCQSSLYAPMAATPLPLAGPEVFAVLWQDTAACVFGPSLRDPGGRRVDYGVDPPAATMVTVGYADSFPPLPRPGSDGGASLATLGNDSLAVWHAHIENSSPPNIYGHFVSGAWLAGDGTSAAFTVSTRQPGIGTQLHPSVAPATDKFLVAWAEGPIDVATEIRGMRVTKLDGPLDGAGGLLLATTSGGAAVIGGPVAAFDGSVWLVAWTEVGVGGNDLRAVAIATDGTVLDATPRLLASGLSNAEPSIASAGDGRSLVIYVRPDGGKSAVRAQLVPGS